jgi:acyl homoserine lactone synthase
MAFLVNGAQLERYPDIRDSMYRLRKKVFSDHLGWEVHVDGDREYDEFDRPDTVYVLYVKDQEVYGVWRILPTTGPYMLADVFPDLAPRGGIPRDTATWELSRYCMDVEFFGGNELALHRAQLDMFCTLAEFAILYGIEELLLVQEPSMTRRANTVFGIPHEVTLPVNKGKANAQTVLYRPAFLKDLRQAQHLYGFKVPTTESFNVLNIPDEVVPARGIRAAE